MISLYDEEKQAIKELAPLIIDVGRDVTRIMCNEDYKDESDTSSLSEFTAKLSNQIIQHVFADIVSGAYFITAP